MAHFAPIWMLFLCGFATCAGSTGGGIKLVRSLLLLKQARRELTRILHPRAVQPVTLGGSVVSHEVLFAVLAFMLIYGAVTIGATMLLLLSGLDAITISYDYNDSLRNLDRGFAKTITLEPTNDDAIGVGVAMTPAVKRDEGVRIFV